VDLVVIDLLLPDGEGIGLLKELKDAMPDPTGPDVIIISGAATVDSAIDALRLGALDYLTKPLDLHRMKAVLANVVRVRSLKDEVGTLRGELRKLGRFGRLIGVSPRMQTVYDLIAKAAPTDATVLITGRRHRKELVAQTVSTQRSSPPAVLSARLWSVSPTLIERAVRTGGQSRCDPAPPRLLGRLGGTLFRRSRDADRAQASCACSTGKLTRVGRRIAVDVLIATQPRAQGRQGQEAGEISTG
jgi:CheY-like chemotaxis protein